MKIKIKANLKYETLFISISSFKLIKNNISMELRPVSIPTYYTNSKYSLYNVFYNKDNYIVLERLPKSTYYTLLRNIYLYKVKYNICRKNSFKDAIDIEAHVED